MSLDEGIGVLESIDDGQESEEEEVADNDVEANGNKSTEAKTTSDDSRPRQVSSAYSVAELLEKYHKPDVSLDSKPYFRLLLPREFVVKESTIWKRSGWSFRQRILVLTSKPRLFYTTLSGDYKGMIPWSMTEPIDVEMKSKSLFDISIHSSSRVYHIYDRISGAEEWVNIINEVLLFSTFTLCFANICPFTLRFRTAGRIT